MPQIQRAAGGGKNRGASARGEKHRDRIGRGHAVVSDPGNIVCEVLKEKGVEYTVIPGANAALCALILSGLPADQVFIRGVSARKERRKARRA